MKGVDEFLCKGGGVLSKFIRPVDNFVVYVGKIIVCADGSFPELPRILALKGAEIICCCLNTPKRQDEEFAKERIAHIAACRAIENMCFYIGCNRVGSDDPTLPSERS